MGNHIDKEEEIAPVLCPINNVLLVTELFAKIVFYFVCDCKTFMYFVSTCKRFRTIYMLDSGYMLSHTLDKYQQGGQLMTPSLMPTTLYKLHIVHGFKLTVENKIINNTVGDHKLISPLQQLANHTANPFVFDQLYINKFDIQIFNIVDNLIREKYGYKISFHGHGQPSDNPPVIEFPVEFSDKLSKIEKSKYFVWVEPVRDNFKSYLF